MSASMAAKHVLVHTELTAAQRAECVRVASRDGHWYAHTPIVEELLQLGYARIRRQSPGSFVACLTPAGYFAGRPKGGRS